MSNPFLINRRNFLFSCLAFNTSSFWSKALAQAQPSVSFKPFSFIFISDCHLCNRVADSYKLTNESQLFLQETIKQINLLKPDFIVFGGDQVDSPGDEDANWQFFLDIMERLDCPWYFVLGEADISGAYSIDKMHTYGRDWHGRGINNSQPYWSYDPLPGVHLIGLDTSVADSTTGYISDQQLQWLKQDLAQQEGSLILLVSHHPLLPPAPFNDGNQGQQYLLPQAPLVRDILANSGKQIIALNGHVHISKIERQENVWYVSSPSLDIYPCSFRRFQVTPQQIELETHQINFPALVKKAKDNLLNSNLASNLTDNRPRTFLELAAGKRNDQRASLTF